MRIKLRICKIYLDVHLLGSSNNSSSSSSKNNSRRSSSSSSGKFYTRSLLNSIGNILYSNRTTTTAAVAAAASKEGGDVEQEHEEACGGGGNGSNPVQMIDFEYSSYNYRFELENCQFPQQNHLFLLFCLFGNKMLSLQKQNLIQKSNYKSHKITQVLLVYILLVVISIGFFIQNS